MLQQMPLEIEVNEWSQMGVNGPVCQIAAVTPITHINIAIAKAMHDTYTEKQLTSCLNAGIIHSLRSITLSVPNSQFHSFWSTISSIPSLHTLTCYEANMEVLLDTIPDCASLTNLKLKGMKETQGDVFEYIGLCTQLTSLSLSSSYCDLHFLSSLSSTLTTLELECEPDDLTPILALTNLTWLDLRCPNTELMAVLPTMQRKMKKLRTVIVDVQLNRDKQIIKNIFKQMFSREWTALQELDIPTIRTEFDLRTLALPIFLTAYQDNNIVNAQGQVVDMKFLEALATHTF